MAPALDLDGGKLVPGTLAAIGSSCACSTGQLLAELDRSGKDQVSIDLDPDARAMPSDDDEQRVGYNAPGAHVDVEEGGHRHRRPGGVEPGPSSCEQHLAPTAVAVMAALRRGAHRGGSRR